jgi:hypothetical protein
MAQPQKFEGEDDPDQEIVFTTEEPNAYYSTLASQPTQVSNVLTEHISHRMKSMDIGFNSILLKLVKLILPLMLPFITHTFNTVFTKSTYPKSWKISKVMLIAKVTNPSTPAYYRSVSFLLLLSRALELLMKDQFLASVIRNSLLNRCLI